MGGILMTRRTIDLLLSWTGLVVAIVLLVTGGLLLWGSNFVNDQVRGQLSEQRIFFPPSDSPSVQGPEFADMREYGGEQLLTGPQAETYANDFIAVHLDEVADGQTYAEVSTAAQADPDNEQLQAQAQTLFRGTTLRGLLLNAHAFWTVGQVAFIAAIVSLVGGAVLVLLAVLGLRHAARLRRTEQPVDLRRVESAGSRAA
jgi:hypothetical protein